MTCEVLSSGLFGLFLVVVTFLIVLMGLTESYVSVDFRIAIETSNFAD